MRTRLIIAFILVALLSALAASWFISMTLPWQRLPSWLADVLRAPQPLRRLLDAVPRGRGQPEYAPLPDALAYFVPAAGVLLALITGVAVAASRRVLLPVRRLADAARHMSGGDLSVRIQPLGRDELAQLTGTFNEMAASLEDKVGELRAADKPASLRHLDAEVGAAGVAHRGDARGQGQFRVPHGLVEVQRERRRLPFQRVERAIHQVHVAVEHARQHRLPGAVHRLVAIQAGADLDDAPVLDHHVGRARLAPGAVEDLSASEHDPAHDFSKAYRLAFMQ